MELGTWPTGCNGQRYVQKFALNQCAFRHVSDFARVSFGLLAPKGRFRFNGIDREPILDRPKKEKEEKENEQEDKETKTQTKQGEGPRSFDRRRPIRGHSG